MACLHVTPGYSLPGYALPGYIFPGYTLPGYALPGYALLCHTCCVCRWLKYEEKVEAGDRWSKPHVATTSLHSINEVKRALQEQVVCMDLPAPHGCMPQVSGECVCVSVCV